MWYVRKEGAERSRLFGKIKVCAIARVSLQTSRLDHHAELYLETLQAEFIEHEEAITTTFHQWFRAGVTKHKVLTEDNLLCGGDAHQEQGGLDPVVL